MNDDDGGRARTTSPVYGAPGADPVHRRSPVRGSGKRATAYQRPRPSLRAHGVDVSDIPYTHGLAAGLDSDRAAMRSICGPGQVKGVPRRSLVRPGSGTAGLRRGSTESLITALRRPAWEAAIPRHPAFNRAPRPQRPTHRLAAG